MLDVIEKLLTLQERDRKIIHVREALAHIAPERQQYTARSAGTQARLDEARQKAKQIESDRKKLELDVEAKKQQIEKYSLQQFQTKKNDEYKALAHEIELCKEAIVKLEDQQLELMEKLEQAQKEVAAATQVAQQAKKEVDAHLQTVDAREKTLKEELAVFESNRAEIASAVDESARLRYERLLKNKGETVIVGVQHGVCGGCHVRLPAQVLLSCRAQQEIVTCPNCGRILYFTSEMDMAMAE